MIDNLKNPHILRLFISSRAMLQFHSESHPQCIRCYQPAHVPSCVAAEVGWLNDCFIFP